MTAEVAELPLYEVSCRDCQWLSGPYDRRSVAETRAVAHDEAMHPTVEEEDA